MHALNVAHVHELLPYACIGAILPSQRQLGTCTCLARADRTATNTVGSIVK